MTAPAPISQLHRGNGSHIGAIVGIDGCGKSSTFEDVVTVLARSVETAGLGDGVLSGEPGQPVRPRTDIPLSRSARAVGALAKGLRRPQLYKDLKLLEFTERTHIRNYVLRHDAPHALMTDGDPLVNVAAWAIARYSRGELMDEDRLVDVLHYLAGDRLIPVRELGYYVRHGWQLALLNRLRLAKFGFPDLVVLLEIDPAIAMERIRARGRPLQIHENVTFLAELAAAYERVCAVLETRCGIPILRLRVDRLTHDETVAAVAETMLTLVRPAGAPGFDPETIEVIATTMSGSFADQRKVGRIEPSLQAVTARPVRVHAVDSHAEAARTARTIVAGGGRSLVSAGGAGTLNAVLEGCHVAGGVPPDLRLAFLRKGSADLIGKVLHVPDDVDQATAAIAAGLGADRKLPADILEVATTEPDGERQVRHVIGFAGLGVFGDVPRFTESRVVKLYKGLLGTLFGDLGPFYFGLALATARWWVLRLLGLVPPIALKLDEELLPAERWAAVILLNGDLGKDFPLGRGLALASSTFRVVMLRYQGARRLLRQIGACRTGSLLEHPDRYGAIVRDVRKLTAVPAGPARRFMVNVDGLRLLTRGTIEISVSGRIHLIDAAPESDPGAAHDAVAAASQ